MEKDNYIIVVIVAIVAIVGMIAIFANNTNKVAYVDSGNDVVSSGNSAGNIGGQAYNPNINQVGSSSEEPLIGINLGEIIDKAKELMNKNWTKTWS